MCKYLVMNTFSGRYLNERSNNNIGHENINFFMPFGTYNNFLLWFNSDGTCDKRCNSNDGEITLLMVTNYGNEKNKFRVLAKAEKCHIIKGDSISIKSKNEQEKLEVVKLKDVKYGQVKIEDIFKDNTYHGKPHSKKIYATFYTDKANMFVPKNEKETIIISKNNEDADIKQNMSSEKMRMYIADDNDAEFEKIINKIAWEPFHSEQNILPHFTRDKKHYKAKETFFTATENEKDELTISNIIAYSLFNSPKLFNQFIMDLTKKEVNKIGAKYTIKREDKHVDLTILLDDTTIIIENKIDSNVILYDNIDEIKNQLKKTYSKPKSNPKIQTLDKIVADKLDEIDSSIVKVSQLTKYYIQSLIDAELYDRKKSEIFYFLLVPDYNVNKFEIDEHEHSVCGYAYSKSYKLITYSELLNIFKKVKHYKYKKEIEKEFELLSHQINDFDQNWEIYKFLEKAKIK